MTYVDSSVSTSQRCGSMEDTVIRLTPIFNSRVPASTGILGHLHLNTIEIGIPNDF